ncbi:mucin-3A-like isoform X2, partial [Clarias magur]
VNEAYDDPAQSNKNFYNQSTTTQRTAAPTNPSSSKFSLPQDGISLQSMHGNHP